MAESKLTPISFGNNPVLKAKNSAGLKKCFQAIVDRKQIDLDSLNPDLSSVLPYMLIFYIKNWPGWHKSKEYYSGKLNYREWFLKFRQYIILRLTVLIKQGYTDVLSSLAKDQEDKLKKYQNSLLDKGTQTDYSVPTAIAPFAISIHCNPKMLNSLIFSDTDGDILLSQHIEDQWFPITITDLVNWPHVGIEFVSSALSFKRDNKSEYRRYVNFIDCNLDKITTSYVENVEIVNPGLERQCYTRELLLLYAQQYIEILHKVPYLSETKLLAVKVLMQTILADVLEIGKLLGQKEPDITIATNTSILFNIGQSFFVRNKKLGKSKTIQALNDKQVGYCEIYIPKIELQINSLKAEQDTTTSNISFVNLNLMKSLIEIESSIEFDSDLAHSREPILKFKCLFCDILYDKHESLINHFSSAHSMEPKFQCAKCLMMLNVNILSRARWKHVCEK